jgi:hypothetical protein
MNQDSIREKLFAKDVLRQAPGLTQVTVPLEIEDLILSPITRDEVLSYLDALDDPSFSRDTKMPAELAKRVIKMLVKEMEPKYGRVSFHHILEGLSFQLAMDYAELYGLLGLDSPEINKFRELLVVEPIDEVITSAIAILKKIINSLGLDQVEAERVIQAHFVALYPDLITLKDEDDPGYEADKIDPDAIAAANRVIKALFG